jgi:hypothetical protein
VTATIAYDKSVKNLIDKLSATGHVTHTAYKKKSVTLHHNGGRLSHEGVLKVWQTRPASAHFDVDSAGAVAQYVKVNEYAWAVGNAKGNQETISIEMADATLAPGWTVADVTWKSAARLAGWLFAKVVDGTPRPTKDNFFYHHHWSSTACAGPYMDKIYAKVLKAAQEAYDSFKAKKSTPSSSGSSTPAKKTITDIAKEVLAGKYGNGPERKRKLIAKGYNYKKVQAEVTRLLSTNHAATGPKGPKTYKQLADEVYRGLWGDDPERSKKLKAAGYDPAHVQREVNHLVIARG